MIQKISTLVTILVLLLSISCKEEENKDFLISKNQIGNLKKGSLARDIELIFEKDSVIQDTVKLNFGSGASKIKIYEKGGNLLLALTPNTDSIPTIQNVQINDTRFTTEKGVNKGSSFLEIKKNHPIKKVITSLNNVVVLLEDSDLYFTIDKSELPENIRSNYSIEVKETDIPDTAKVKYMMIGWD